MPSFAAEVRAEVCARCDDQCQSFLSGKIDHGDPCVSCPRPWPSRWGQYGGQCLEFSQAEQVSSRIVDDLPEEPTAVELAGNFVGAMARWSTAGFATVSAEDYAARGAVCDACEFWDGAARLGLGKCNAPGCGCTKLKRWLSTEKCPLGKWQNLSS